ncbi:hypothetical protein [Ralstonia insidiosa]|nr:hypothetical protein [Ralstonia insidiosa]MBA9939309.1 hypothetical protein [Ralstonia insidiosa]MBC9968082.1 hypothetical protein [Ralstonia insidiosa]MBX3904355.1 hypothetical protein [Ralstonia insidiosa]
MLKQLWERLAGRTQLPKSVVVGDSRGIVVGDHGMDAPVVPRGTTNLSVALAIWQAQRMTDAERDAHMEVFGSPSAKELYASIRNQTAGSAARAEGIPPKGGLFPLTWRLLEVYGGLIKKVEGHAPDEPDCGDRLWLSVEENALTEGEFISIGPLSEHHWRANHDLAHKYGGYPTVWETGGSEHAVWEAVSAYLAARR